MNMLAITARCGSVVRAGRDAHARPVIVAHIGTRPRRRKQIVVRSYWHWHHESDSYEGALHAIAAQPADGGLDWQHEDQ